MLRYIYCSLFIVLCILPLSGQKKTNPVPENISLSTDRNLYVAGEWLYFNLFLHTDSSSGCLHGSHYAYLVLRNVKNEHVSDNIINIISSSSYGSIYLPDTLATGIYQIVAFTNVMRNYSEDYYFTKSIVIANRFDKDLTFFDRYPTNETTDPAKEKSDKDSIFKISLNKRNFSCREKVNIRIQMQSPSDKSLISIAVKPFSPISIIENKPVTSMVTLPKECKYEHEIQDIILQGNIFDEKNKPISRAIVFLSTPDSIVNLQYYRTNIKGAFHFHLNSYYDGKLLFLKVKGYPKVKIEVADKFAIKMPFTLPLINIDGNVKAFLTKLQITVNVQKSLNQIFKSDIVFDKSKGYRPLVFVKPYSVVFPSEYTYLPSFADISQELMPFLKVRLKNNEYTAEMVDITKNEFVKPLIFLDGVLMDSIQQVIQLDSKRIYKIESFPKARYLGSIYMPGILSVFSTNHEIQKIKWLLPTLSFQNTSKLTFSKYYTGSLETLAKHTPDFRQLLYWEPSISLANGSEKSIEFTTSDCTGNFEICIEGTTPDGRMCKYKNVIRVTSNLNK